MTLEPVEPKEYKFFEDGIYHIGSGCNDWIAPSNDLDQVLRDLELHEKKKHQAKVIQMNAVKTTKVTHL